MVIDQAKLSERYDDGCEMARRTGWRRGGRFTSESMVTVSAKAHSWKAGGESVSSRIVFGFKLHVPLLAFEIVSGVK